MPRLGSQVRLFPLDAVSWAEPNPSLAKPRDRCPPRGQAPPGPTQMGLISATLLAPPTRPDSAQTWGFPPLLSEQRRLSKPGAFPWVTTQPGHDPNTFCFPGKRRSWEGRGEAEPRKKAGGCFTFISLYPTRFLTGNKLNQLWPCR